MKAECEKFGEVRKVIVFDVSVSHLGTRCKVYKHIFKLMLPVIQFLVGISQESYNFVKLYLLCFFRFMCLPIVVIEVCVKLSFIDLSC